MMTTIRPCSHLLEYPSSMKFKRTTCVFGTAVSRKTITISYEAYAMLKRRKKEGESFSELILRTYGKSNASEILAYLKEAGPDPELADAVEEASREHRRNFRLRRVDL